MDNHDASCGRNGFRWFELATRASRLGRAFYRELMEADAEERDESASGYTVLARDATSAFPREAAKSPSIDTLRA